MESLLEKRQNARLSRLACLALFVSEMCHPSSGVATFAISMAPATPSLRPVILVVVVLDVVIHRRIQRQTVYRMATLPTSQALHGGQ
jgi:hypothetical protein